MVGLYASSMPHDQLRRNGVEPEEVVPIIEAIGAGDLAKGIELTSADLADRLSIAGTPGECLEKIQREIAPTGINHMILAVTDGALVKALTAREIEGVADVNTHEQAHRIFLVTGHLDPGRHPSARPWRNAGHARRARAGHRAG